MPVPWYIWLIVVIAIIVLILIIICTVYYCMHNLKILCTQPQSSSKLKHSTTELVELDTGHPVRMEEDRTNWELDRKHINLRVQLGIGEFGPIYDAEVQLGVNLMSRAAIKDAFLYKFKVFQQGTTQDLVRFREEVEGIMHLHHPCIGRVFGLVPHPPYYLVLELTINGDLKTFLLTASQGASNKLSSAQLVAMATDVSSGLSYMELKGYVHQDVATRNCMVMQNLSVKINDFKLGRHLHRSEYAVQNDGSLMPIRWMAPESLSQNTFNLKSTVWSFGVLAWEVMSHGRFPYQELEDGHVIDAVCNTRHRLLQPADCPNSVYSEMLCCWNYNASNRPTMEDLHQKLKSSILR